MELRGAVGELTGTVNGLARTVEGQSKKLDELTKRVEDYRGEVTKLYGGLHLARWVLGTLIAIAGLVLWRLPAIIEALRATVPTG